MKRIHVIPENSSGLRSVFPRRAAVVLFFPRIASMATRDNEFSDERAWMERVARCRTCVSWIYASGRGAFLRTSGEISRDFCPCIIFALPRTDGSHKRDSVYVAVYAVGMHGTCTRELLTAVSTYRNRQWRSQDLIWGQPS